MTRQGKGCAFPNRVDIEHEAISESARLRPIWCICQEISRFGDDGHEANNAERPGC
jgi:hypothetical protein